MADAKRQLDGKIVACRDIEEGEIITVDISLQPLQPVTCEKDVLFIRMYKHMNGNYQPNFNIFADSWCKRHIPNYQHLNVKLDPFKRATRV